MIVDVKKELVLAIVDFLSTAVTDGSVSADDKDSVQVAIECLQDVFQVQDQTSKDSDSLLTLYTAYKTSEPKRQEVSDASKAKAEALKLDGNRAVGSKAYKDAVDFYTQAVALNPYNPIYFGNRAAAHSSLGDQESAIADSKQALELDPLYSKAYSRLGLAHYANGNPLASMKAYQKGLALEGDKPSAAMLKGFETAKKRVEESNIVDDGVESDDGSTVTPNAEADDATAEATSSGTNSFASASATGGKKSASAFSGFPTGDIPAGVSGNDNTKSATSSSSSSSSGFPDLSGLMNNPQLASVAQKLMANPGALGGLFSDPHVQQMASNAKNGNLPSVTDLMGNPALQDLMKSFMNSAGAPPK